MNYGYTKIIEKENKIENKNRLGNLVLLDSYTNRSYKNALFPIKRKTIIENTQKIYIPHCTQRVFMKFYTQDNNVDMRYWTEKDCENYEADMKDKLKFYFNDNNNEE